MRSISLGCELGKCLADRRRELEAVAAAGGADDVATVTLADEALVPHVRVDAGLGPDRGRVDSRQAAGYPLADRLDDVVVRSGVVVGGIGRLAGLVPPRLDSDARRGQRVELAAELVDERRHRLALEV